MARYNPEKKTFRGISYKRCKRVTALRRKLAIRSEARGTGLHISAWCKRGRDKIS